MHCDRWLEELRVRAETLLCELRRGVLSSAEEWAESIVKMARESIGALTNAPEPVPAWMFGHYETLYAQQNALIDQLQSELRSLRACRKVDGVREVEKDDRLFSVWDATDERWAIRSEGMSATDAENMATWLRANYTRRTFEVRPYPPKPEPKPEHETWGVWNVTTNDWANVGRFDEREANQIAETFRDRHRPCRYEARPRHAEPLLYGGIAPAQPTVRTGGD